MQSQNQQSTDDLGRVNLAAGSMTLAGLDEVDPDSADHFGATSAGALKSRRKGQERRAAHQSNNPSFANNVDNMAIKASGSSLLAEQMLLHPRDAASSAMTKQKSDPPRSKQVGYLPKHAAGLLEHYQQPQEEPQQSLDENVCDDESLVVDPNNNFHYQHAAMDNSMEGTIYSSSQMMPTPTGAAQANMAASNHFISPNIAKFKQNLLKTLQKFAKVHTQKKAAEELKQLMTTDITDNERMNMFLNQLAEINDHMNLGQMKEQFKQFGLASEIFEDALVPFIPKILNNFQKKIRDEATVKLHPVISEALGQLEWHVLGRVEDSEEQLQLFERHFQKFAFGMIEKTKSKNVQCGAIACLTKIIVNCPDDILFEKFEEITDKMCEIVKTKQFLAHQQFLESLISLIFHIQIDFKYYYEKFLPYLIEQIQKSKDAQTKRVAIDALYSIGAHLKDEITGHIDDLLPILNVCRVDKNQPVRAAAQETIKLFKELKEQKLNQSFDDQISNEYFQQDLIQDNDVLDNLNDSTYIDKNLARTDTRKKKKMPAASSNMAMLVRDEAQKNNNNLYPSFADMQSSHEQHINSGQGQYSNQYIEPLPDDTKNNRRPERSLSQSKNNDVNDRKATKQRIMPYQRPGRCKSPSLNQNVGEIDDPEEHMTSVRSQKAAVLSKSRAQADSRRRQDSLKQGKSNLMKSQTNIRDSVSPNRLGSPVQQPQDGKSHRSNVKRTSQPGLDASIEVLNQQQEMLLNPSYLKDKSIKKVSIATLKRRMNQQKSNASPEKGPNSASAQEKQNSRQRINSIRKANLRLGFKSKQDQSEYDEVPLSQKSAATPNQKRGNFLDKLNPSFMNKFNDKDQIVGLRDKDRAKQGSKFGGKVMTAESISAISEINGVDNDVSITVVSGKPPDFEYLQEIQRMAEIKYEEQRREEEEKYKGLNSLQKRKKILEETQLLMTQGDKSAEKKASKSAKPAKEKKDARAKPPKSQRPKWQNIIDDDEDDKKEEDDLRYQDERADRGSASAEKKSRGKHKQSIRNNMLDSDREHDNVTEEDVQIIIKTDKHSQQRTSKKDIYESEYNESRAGPADQPQTTDSNPGFHTVNQSRDSRNRDDELESMRKQNMNYNQQEESFDNASQPAKQPTGIVWLSQGKQPAQEDQKAETGSMSHHSMQRGALKMGSMAQELANQQNDGLFRTNMVSDAASDSNRGQFMLKNQMKTFEQSRQPHPDQSRMLHQQHNSNNEIVNQTSILQQIQQQMMHFQLEQQKQMQSIEIFNSKFETVVGKLNTIQKNYEQLESQQNEMEIQLQKQARATDLLNEQYRSLLQHQTTGTTALTPNHRTNTNFNPAGTFAGIQDSASIGHLLQEVTPSVHQSEANSDQLQKQLLQEFYQKLERDRVLAGQQQKLEQIQREQQKEQQSRDIQQLNTLLNRLNNKNQAQSPLQMPELGSLVQQTQNAQQTQGDQMSQIKKLQESLDIVQAISSKGSGSTSDQLLSTLLLSQKIQQRQQQLGSEASTSQATGLPLQQQSTPSNALQGANPLLLSHLLNMNQTNKQSVLEPSSNQDNRAFSALASNRDTPSNAALIAGVENVSSAVNSLAFMGDGSDASQKQSTATHQDGSHASQRDY